MTVVVRDRKAKADEVTIKGGGAGVFEERRKRPHPEGEKAPVKLRMSRSDVSRSRNTGGGGGGKDRVGSGEEVVSDAGVGEKKDEEEMETVDVKEVDGNAVEDDEETLPIVPFVENVDSIATKPENVEEEEEEEKLLLLPPIGNNPNCPNAEKKKRFDEEVTTLPSSKISLNFPFFLTSMSRRSDFYMIDAQISLLFSCSVK